MGICAHSGEEKKTEVNLSNEKIGEKSTKPVDEKKAQDGTEAGEMIRIKVSCTDLPFPNIDPCIVLREKKGQFSNIDSKFDSDNWEEIGRTENLTDNPNPVFTRPLTLKYVIEKNQEVSARA